MTWTCPTCVDPPEWHDTDGCHRTVVTDSGPDSLTTRRCPCRETPTPEPATIWLLLDAQAEDAIDSSYTANDIIRGAYRTEHEAMLVGATWPDHVTRYRILPVAISTVADGSVPFHGTHNDDPT
jgi:hypothetical protein